VDKVCNIRGRAGEAGWRLSFSARKPRSVGRWPLRSFGAIGDDWVKTARSAILPLPCVITGETNYLINPAHPDFGKIKIGKPEPFSFDPRLLT
jgi:RES domain-containing protein